MLGNKSERDLKEIRPILDQCLAAYEKISKLSNDELRAKTQEFRQKIQDKVKGKKEEVEALKAKIAANVDDSLSVEEKEHIYASIDKLEKEIYNQTQDVLNEILPEAFAVVKSTAQRFKDNAEVEVTAMPWDGDLAATRDNVTIRGDKAYYKNQWMAGGNLITWDMVHYDVQLIGGIVLHQGKIAEMSTGEGKTLVETLPVYLNALPGQGVHVVTVNDYLAKRDSEWMGMLFEFHGLKVDCIDKHQPSSEARRKAYLADITYGTNNEFGFDYLRDNMCRTPQELVQRGHNYAIVDEVDSVLIDDARTPLIISGPTFKAEDQEFDTLRPQIEKLYNQQRALVTKILAEAKSLLSGTPTPEQEKKGGELLFRAHRGLPKNSALIKFLSEPGMKALMQKTENYYLQEQGKNMPLIDGELYFVIDEKLNSIDLTDNRVLDYIDRKPTSAAPSAPSVAPHSEQQAGPYREQKAGPYREQNGDPKTGLNAAQSASLNVAVPNGAAPDTPCVAAFVAERSPATVSATEAVAAVPQRVATTGDPNAPTNTSACEPTVSVEGYQVFTGSTGSEGSAVPLKRQYPNSAFFTTARLSDKGDKHE